MKTIDLKTVYCVQRTVKIQQIWLGSKEYYRFSILERSARNHRYDSQQVYSSETAACEAAYFFCLRFRSDRDPVPSLVIALKTGDILSTNLPAFEMLGIHATGLRWTDFMAHPELYEEMRQQLQQVGQYRRSLLICNADRDWLHCEMDAHLETSGDSDWATLRLNAHPSKDCNIQPDP